MRRFVAGFSVVAVMLFATQAGAEEIPEFEASYFDTFTSGTYFGSDGTILWLTSWKESGESDGPLLGAIRVENDDNCPDGLCVVMEGEGGSELIQLSITRGADLSLFSAADLSYDVRRMFDEEKEGEVGATLEVQITKDGKSWKTIKSLNINTIDPAPLHKTHGIDDHLVANFAVRFVVQGSLAGEVLIDNVEIKGTIEVPGTTVTLPPISSSTTSSTTTTRPNATTTTRPTTTTTEAPTTTTTAPEASTTTTTVPEGDDDDFTTVVPTRPPDSGLRESTTGLQANFETSLFGDMEGPQVLSFEATADYLIAYEAIESSWVWVAGLSALIAWAIVSNMDRRRPFKAPRSDDV